MKIVIDTNVVISGTFFGGYPGRVVEAVAENKIKACASASITEEYNEIVKEIIDRKQGKLKKDLLDLFIANLEIIEPTTEVQVSRDPDDDKFIECAIDAKALFIVSGDQDLLDIGKYNGVEIITAAEFCRKYL